MMTMVRFRLYCDVREVDRLISVLGQEWMVTFNPMGNPWHTFYKGMLYPVT